MHLRGLFQRAEGKPGSIVLGTGMGSESVTLPDLEIQAALALLIERQELFLASFNVKIERSE